MITFTTARIALALLLGTAGTATAGDGRSGETRKVPTGRRETVSVTQFKSGAHAAEWISTSLEKARSMQPGGGRETALLEIVSSAKAFHRSRLSSREFDAGSVADQITIGMKSAEAALMASAPKMALDLISEIGSQRMKDHDPSNLALYLERADEASQLMGNAPNYALGCYERALAAEPDDTLRPLILVRIADRRVLLGEEKQVVAVLEEASAALPADTLLGVYVRAALARAYSGNDPKRARVFHGIAKDSLEKGSLRSTRDLRLAETYVPEPTTEDIDKLLREAARGL